MTCPRCPLCGVCHLTVAEAYRIHNHSHYRIFRDGSMHLWRDGEYLEIEPPGTYPTSHALEQGP